MSVAVLSETETSHSIAKTANIEGFQAFCPPDSVTGPSKKECGVILMVSNMLSVACKPRPDINAEDTVQTIWIEVTTHNLLICGVYRRARSSSDLENAEFEQLTNQVLKAARTGKKVLVLGDMNVDHTNHKHKKFREGGYFLNTLEAANIRRLPNLIPTFKSFGLHKVCKCETSCSCIKEHRTSVIDLSLIHI